jgi:hypothetical protein
MTMLPVLPRGFCLLRIPTNRQSNVLCIRTIDPFVARPRRSFHASVVTHNLTPPTPPDISKCTGVDLNEVVGSPGWKIDDLLPQRTASSERTSDNSITLETLRHLLHLSALPPPQTSQEESNLLSALHDQLHFVRHVQSVPTEHINPLIRIGHESDPETDTVGVLSYEECVEESKAEEIPGLEWTPWDVCSLKGGSPEGREDGWFTVKDTRTNQEKEQVHE